MISDVSKCINITRVQSPKQTFHTLKIIFIFCFVLFCFARCTSPLFSVLCLYLFLLRPLSFSPSFLPWSPCNDVNLSQTFLRRRKTRRRSCLLSSVYAERRRKQGERERREETRRKERTGGRKGEKEGRGEEREKNETGVVDVAVAVGRGVSYLARAALLKHPWVAVSGATTTLRAA